MSPLLSSSPPPPPSLNSPMPPPLSPLSFPSPPSPPPSPPLPLPLHPSSTPLSAYTHRRFPEYASGYFQDEGELIIFRSIYCIQSTLLDHHEGIGGRNQGIFPESMWSNSSHCNSNAGTHGILRETASVSDVLYILHLVTTVVFYKITRSTVCIRCCASHATRNDKEKSTT